MMHCQTQIKILSVHFPNIQDRHIKRKQETWERVLNKPLQILQNPILGSGKYIRPSSYMKHDSTALYTCSPCDCIIR